MQVISKHNCRKHHRNALYFARCAWPDAAAVIGTGQLALVTSCGDTRIYLVERLRPAQTLRQEFNVFGCGRGCTRKHELVAIDYDAPAEEPT